ncbi:iron uptake transporter deferrochelatase/peroxidase subunit [Paenibacillus macquariensis]|uniref:Deferrochelatase n=1 Tax=Paenibacillus macquariensis TaxID=948756 RepID=A0ABY1K1M3_9BACL|nr:iron uptake transporter deferrochelatase/peroxidase subunit [Paenibacillus macquariensis]MEC0091718.1 iron uptake transporter deferrochelatase/peroxidase subunit [Paenibacillus macquariensis]OAB32356.1 deferrochelatase [Paenibacillus macquariensis subsp. macquariensis]SIR13376.1 deferrochelatase/peroxidase EfeB [Paenibacillus macquariensis]
MKKDNNDKNNLMLNKKLSRRDMLRLAGVGGVGLLLGGGAIGSLLASDKKTTSNASTILSQDQDSIPFYGAHQAGIITPSQNFICFAAFDVITDNVSDIRKMFQKWTTASATMVSGSLIGNVNDNPNLPPSDTGEAAELSPSRCTITFGAGPSLFDARFGLQNKRPPSFQELPPFKADSLEPEWCGGDLCVQVCADDLQVAFHAIRNLARIARGTAVLRWTQEGFQRSTQADPKATTPRNLLGFKDGTANPNVTDSKLMNEVVWSQSVDGTAWMTGGSYMAVRRVRMRIEVWDRSTLKDQEDTFGRHRHSGAPLGSKDEFDSIKLDALDATTGKPVIPSNSHVALAHGDGSIQMLRRSYSYSSGLDLKTGQLDAGLLFISFQRDLQKQFIPIQQRLANNDKLNEYAVHKGSAVFACFPGTTEGGFIGETLFGGI